MKPNIIKMNTTETLDQLRRLKLSGMAESYQTQLELPADKQLESDDLVTEFTQSEIMTMTNERAAYYL